MKNLDRCGMFRMAGWMWQREVEGVAQYLAGDMGTRGAG